MKRSKIRAICFIFIANLLCFNVFAANNSSTIISSPEQTQSMKNKTEGVTFLEENKKKPGIISLPNGLQYNVITQGNGNKPKETDTVTVNYIGTLINGTEFDSSFKHGQPVSFPLRNVIPGWTQILQLMPVGSTWEVYIPAELAYGERGAPPVIGPNQTLIFKITLLSINN